MNDVTFAPEAWKEYMDWQKEDKKTAKRINELIRDIQINGYMTGIGKPEILKHTKSYSRRIDGANRLLYIGDDSGNIRILACKDHYKD